MRRDEIEGNKRLIRKETKEKKNFFSFSQTIEPKLPSRKKKKKKEKKHPYTCIFSSFVTCDILFVETLAGLDSAKKPSFLLSIHTPRRLDKPREIVRKI